MQGKHTGTPITEQLIIGYLTPILVQCSFPYPTRGRSIYTGLEKRSQALDQKWVMGGQDQLFKGISLILAPVFPIP